jgi:hypothetical protein
MQRHLAGGSVGRCVEPGGRQNWLRSLQNESVSTLLK